MNELIVKEPAEIEAELSDLSQKALSVKVTDDTTLLVADEMLSVIVAMRKKIKDFFKPEKQAADKLHSMICNKENAELAKIMPIETHLKNEIGPYKLKQKAIKDAEEARLRAEAAKREEEERLARAAEIEAEAARLRSAGLSEIAETVQQEAEQVMNTPGFIPAPRVAPVPKTRSTLKMIVDREAIQRAVDLLHERANIPGVHVYHVWQFDIVNESLVPEAYKKPSVGGR